MKNFDFYEFNGLLLPGILALFGVSLLSTGFLSVVGGSSLTVGDLGLFVVLAYIVGHLVQAMSTVLEPFLWNRGGGMPTARIQKEKPRWLTPEQYAQLDSHLKKKLNLSPNGNLQDVASNEWFGITRQVYAAVAAQGRAARVDTFNGTYGLLRGLLTVLLSLIILTSTVAYKVPLGNVQDQYLVALLALVFCTYLIFNRMKRFGGDYAQELFVQFLQLPLSPATQATPSTTSGTILPQTP